MLTDTRFWLLVFLAFCAAAGLLDYSRRLGGGEPSKQTRKPLTLALSAMIMAGLLILIIKELISW